MSETPPSISIPADLLPADGRFASGPSKVRPEAVEGLSAIAGDYLGTSHRKPAVKNMVGRLRDGLTELFSLPEGWEVVLGNGGTTAFWDAATFGLIDTRSLHLSFGEFSSKFAKGVAAAPFLADPVIVATEMGDRPDVDPSSLGRDNVDVYAFTHNETSTGVCQPLLRPTGGNPDAIVAVDATSAAGAIEFDPAEVDCYYFAPQKAFGSEGGLWIALCSPKAQERIQALAAGPRWIPDFLSLGIALDNSTKNQTYNTPSLSTVYFTVDTVEWFNANGGLSWSAGRSSELSGIVYDWAEAHELATPFVADPTKRSPVVATIDFDDSVAVDDIAAALRANGILDTEGYRKLGRNQLRIACFPAIEPDDMRQLTKSIDHVLAQLTL